MLTCDGVDFGPLPALWQGPSLRCAQGNGPGPLPAPRQELGGLRRPFPALWQGVHHLLHQVRDTQPMLCRKRKQPLHAELVKFVEVALAGPGVQLVHRVEHRLGRLPQQLRRGRVQRRGAGPAVQENHDDVGLVHRRQGLLQDPPL